MDNDNTNYLFVWSYVRHSFFMWPAVNGVWYPLFTQETVTTSNIYSTGRIIPTVHDLGSFAMVLHPDRGRRGRANAPEVVRRPSVRQAVPKGLACSSRALTMN